MPLILFRPDNGPYDTGTVTVPDPSQGAQSWTENAWASIDATIRSDWLMYGLVALLAALLAASLIARRKRTDTTTEAKADLTRVDRAVTRITGILATAMVATGAWKVFGDVLHLHPLVRLALFFFAEAQIVSAWRRVRRHIFRHAALGRGIHFIFAIAFGSALIAALDADNLVEIAIRLFAAGVAAFMIAEELVEELDIHLTANPDLRTSQPPSWARRHFDRLLVWLGLAQATHSTIAEFERQRRIARFARTAHRFHLLEEGGAATWRINRVRRKLRRLTESANEHLKLATDRAALNDVRAQLALLYGVEAGTSRKAVADLQPLVPAELLAISATPFVAPIGTPDDSIEGRHELATVIANPGAPEVAGEVDNTGATPPAERPAKKVDSGDATKTPSKPANRAATRRAVEVATEGVHPTALKLAKLLAKYPKETNVELAKRMRVGDRTISRYRAEAEAHNTAIRSPISTPPMTPIAEPNRPVKTGVNGHVHTSLGGTN